MKAKYPKCMPRFYKVGQWWRQIKNEYRRNKCNDALCAKLRDYDNE